MLMTNSALAADDHQSNRIKTIVEEYLQRLD